MAKRRYSANKIARTPSLKRKLAELLAEEMPRDPQISLHNMLAYGHRGYISFDEGVLCKMFDKLFTDKLKQADDEREMINKQKINLNQHWEVRKRQEAIERIEKDILKFKEIADELFEVAFL